jgi:hypothetical protein
MKQMLWSSGPLGITQPDLARFALDIILLN